MGYQAGIDLGTTYTAAAVHRDGRVEVVWLGDRAAVIPTVVFVRSDGSVITGEAATRQGSVEPQRVAREFKRRMGDRVTLMVGGMPFAAERLTARVLEAVVARIGEREGGPPDHLAVTHPANWGPYKLDLLYQAVRQAGLDDLPVSYLTEPQAAAIHYATQERVDPGSIVAVYDLGGGTFDAAVLRRTADGGYEMIGEPEGIEQLGGVDFDAAVLAHVDRSLGGAVARLDPNDSAVALAVARLRTDCVEAKEVLSSDVDVAIPVAVPGLTDTIRLTRVEFEGMIRPAINDSIAALRRAMRSADVTPDEVQGILLVGGSSRVPLVAQMVTSELGRPVAVDAHPKHGVALGAAVWAAQQAVAAPAERITVLPSTEETGAGASPAPPPPSSLHEIAPATPPEPPHPVEEVPEPPSGRRSRLAAVLVALAVVLVGGVAAFLVAGDGRDGQASDQPPGAPTPEQDDVWAASVSPLAGVVKIDRDTGELLAHVPISGLIEEPVVDDEFVWAATVDGDAGVVVHQLDRADGTVRQEIPLAVGAPDGITLELLLSDDGVWVLAVPEGAEPTVVRIAADGEIATSTRLDTATSSVEPLTDGESLFVAAYDGSVRVDEDGAATTGRIPGPAVGGGMAFTDGRLFVVRNDAIHELDPATMAVAASVAYEEGGDTVALLDGGGDGRLHIEEAYGSGSEVSFLASGGTEPGASFIRVDAPTGRILTRVAVPGGLSAGAYDMRQTGPEQFWAYSAGSPPTLLSITGDGEIDAVLELPARGELDADLTTNGERLVVSDVDVEDRPVIYVIEPETGALEATIDEFP